MESARLAQHGDVDRVAQLWALAEEELAGQRGGALLASSVAPAGGLRTALAEAVGEPHRVLAVGTIDDVIVGFGYGRLTVAHPAEPIGVIDALYVEPDARGIGVGEAMAGVLLERLEALGCRGVDAFALPGNRAAKAFFETHGFVTRMLVMHRPARSEG